MDNNFDWSEDEMPTDSDIEFIDDSELSEESYNEWSEEEILSDEWSDESYDEWSSDESYDNLPDEE